MKTTTTLVKWMATLAVIATTGLGASALAQNARNVEEGPSTITLRVYNYAHVNSWALGEEEAEAGRILAQAGIRAQWAECSTSHSVLNDNPASCLTARRMNGYTVMLLPRSMAALQVKTPGAWGTVSGCAKGSCTASVFYDHIHNLAGGDTAQSNIILGRTIAREVGELLLGTSDSSHTGILKPWSVDDLDVAAAPEMVFTAEQSNQMKSLLNQQAQSSVASLGPQ